MGDIGGIVVVLWRKRRRQTLRVATKRLVVGAQEAGLVWLHAQPPRHLAEAGAGEVEHGVGRELIEARKCRVTSCDEPRRMIGLGQRDLVVVGVGRPSMGRLARRQAARKQTRQALDTEQRKRNTGRKQRIDECRCRRQHRPARSAHLSGPPGQPRHPGKRARRRRVGELRRDRRKAPQEPPPRWLTIGQSKIRGQCIGDGNACARHAVPEPQHPHPAAIEYMM